jgi:hypothetical protein
MQRCGAEDRNPIITPSIALGDVTPTSTKAISIGAPQSVGGRLKLFCVLEFRPKKISIASKCWS